MEPERKWNDADAALARKRYYARSARLAAEQQERDARLAAKSGAGAPALAEGAIPDPGALAADARKKAIIAAAVERARLQRAAAQPQNTAAPSAQTARQIAEADARRARLGAAIEKKS